MENPNSNEKAAAEIVRLQNALRELLARVDERCGGKAEGTTELVKACDVAREILPNE